jgi:uncharacterized protein YndB with AHSA1/START domain
MAEIDTTGRQVLRLERKLNHPVERVWEAITDADQLGQWYPLSVETLELHVGGKVAFDDGEGTIYQGEIRELDPPRVFSFSEEEDLVHIELQPEGDGCLMIFIHVFDDPEMAEGNETGWNECLKQLETILNRG